MRLSPLLCALLLTSTVAAAPAARVRLLHAGLGVERVSLVLDGQPLESDLAFGRLTVYRLVAPGPHNLKLLGADGRVLDDRETRLEAGLDYTIAAVGDPPTMLRVRDRTVNDPRHAYLRAVHLAHGAPALTIRPAGDPALGEVAFGQAMRPAVVAPSEYRVELLEPAAEQPLRTLEPLRCDAGVTTTLWLLPDAAVTVHAVVDHQEPQPASAYELAGPAAAEPAPDERPLPKLRLVNLSPARDAADVRLGEAIVGRGLGFGQVTDYVPIGAEPTELLGGPPGGPDARTRLEPARGGEYTAFLCHPLDRLGWWVVLDQPPSDGPPTVRLLHAAIDLARIVVETDGGGWRQEVDFLGLGEALAVADATGPRRFVLRKPGEDTVLRTAEARLELGMHYTLAVCGRLTPGEGEPGLTLRLLREGAARP